MLGTRLRPIHWWSVTSIKGCADHLTLRLHLPSRPVYPYGYGCLATKMRGRRTASDAGRDQINADTDPSDVSVLRTANNYVCRQIQKKKSIYCSYAIVPLTP
jgi:hypothetical protein